MTDIVTQTAYSTTGSRPVPAPQTTTGSSGNAISSDFETFLRMLTVQMQNQDPMDPVDSTDFATQLATFSSVEQQVLTNDILNGIAAQLGVGTLQQAGGWIGMEALARAPARFDGSPVTLRPDIAPDADSAVLVVRDPTGTVIERTQISVDTESHDWHGLDDTGTAHPHGSYRFEIESYVGDQRIDTRIAPVYSRIEEVRSDGGTILVRLSDGTETASTMIDGLRAPRE